MVRQHRVATRKSSNIPVRPERVLYPEGEDQRHDKYLHSSARRARALRMSTGA